MESLRSERNRLSKQIGILMVQKKIDEAEQLKAKVTSFTERNEFEEKKAKDTEDEMTAIHM